MAPAKVHDVYLSSRRGRPAKPAAHSLSEGTGRHKKEPQGRVRALGFRLSLLPQQASEQGGSEVSGFCCRSVGLLGGLLATRSLQKQPRLLRRGKGRGSLRPAWNFRRGAGRIVSVIFVRSVFSCFEEIDQLINSAPYPLLG
jgi:hypothetical protein